MKSTLTGLTEENPVSELPAPSAALSAPVSGGAMVSDKFFSNAEVEGDFDRSDFKIPKLNLVQNVGPLTEHFQPGHFVYAKETDLGQQPIELTLLHLRKFFVEDVPYGSEKFPDIVSHEKELRAKGGFLTKEKKQMGEGHVYYKPTLDATVLIKGRAEDAAFPFDFEGTPYALAVWTLQSVAYGRTATTFMTASQLGLRAGLALGSWTVTPKREKIGANWIWLPIARQTGKNSPEFVAWSKTLLGNGNTQ